MSDTEKLSDFLNSLTDEERTVVLQSVGNLQKVNRIFAVSETSHDMDVATMRAYLTIMEDRCAELGRPLNSERIAYWQHLVEHAMVLVKRLREAI